MCWDDRLEYLLTDAVARRKGKTHESKRRSTERAAAIKPLHWPCGLHSCMKGWVVHSSCSTLVALCLGCQAYRVHSLKAASASAGDSTFN